MRLRVSDWIMRSGVAGGATVRIWNIWTLLMLLVASCDEQPASMRVASTPARRMVRVVFIGNPFLKASRAADVNTDHTGTLNSHVLSPRMPRNPLLSPEICIGSKFPGGRRFPHPGLGHAGGKKMGRSGYSPERPEQ